MPALIYSTSSNGNRVVSHLLGWPTFVVLGQLSLQALGWAFLAVVSAHGTIPLPLSSAVWASKNPHLVTLIATLIATLFAGCSSFFCSYALRRSMSLYLRRPMSLQALAASVNISMRTVVFNRRGWKWPALSLLWFIAAGIQTSVWSTLITPVKVTIMTPLVGREVDLGSVALQEMLATDADNVCATTQTQEIVGSLATSGYANGQTYLGRPAAVEFLGQGFDASTRGILAATLNDTRIGSWFIPATAQSTKTLPRGISSSHEMLQQGFTADVVCAQQDFTTDSPLKVQSATDFVTAWADGPADLSANVSLVQANVTCPSNFNTTLAVVLESFGYLWTLGCDPEPSAPNNHTLIFGSSGRYRNITGVSDASYLVCQVAPKTMIVRANYAGASVNSTAEEADPSSTLIAGGLAGSFTLGLFATLVVSQQGIGSNGLGDQLLELSDTADADQQLRIMEQYIKGVVEYGASVLRACLSVPNDQFESGPPLNITRDTTGTWKTDTMGWKGFSPGTTVWILLPGIFMTLATLALVIVTLYRHWDELHADNSSDTFDPSNPLHLIAAASAGGLDNAFKGFREEDINEGAKIDVSLGSLPGRGLALVRANTHPADPKSQLLGHSPSGSVEDL